MKRSLIKATLKFFLNKDFHINLKRVFRSFACCTICFVQQLNAQDVIETKPAGFLFENVQAGYSGINFSNNIVLDNKKLLKYIYYGNSSGIGIGDFNNDGLPDIFLSGNIVANKLYLNRGDFKFLDVSKEAGVQGKGNWGTGVGVVDINGDGLLDIYVCHSGDFADPAKLRNELYINEGLINNIPHFKESAKSYGLDLPGTQTTQASFFDYDKDGDLDVFILNHSTKQQADILPCSYYRTKPNKNFSNLLLRNDKGHFTDVTTHAGIIGSDINFGLGVVTVDMNEDGWPDIYTTSDFDETDFFYINQKDGTFKEVLKNSFNHISNFSMGVDAADFNNDLLPDIITLDMLPLDNF